MIQLIIYIIYTLRFINFIKISTKIDNSIDNMLIYWKTYFIMAQIFKRTYI